MPSYDFSTLSPPDFEALTRDLLQKALSVRLQSFTTGRDKGIDLRHAPVDGNDWIVQCKHYARTPFSTLLSQLREKELPKVELLRPSRYILATSLGLTPQNVDDIYALFSPYCRSKDDIFGRDDLNGLLAAHPEIETSHFKLWLTSEPVLQRVLHNGVFVQSALTEDRIRRKLSLYVPTKNVEDVRLALESSHVCIISGIPGIGKSTLAEIILVDYVMNGWELVAIQQNIREGQDALRMQPAAKQILYYDDFLGQISTGEKLGKNEDNVILQLISSIQRSPNKRFILTTREYILAQAKAEHEMLSRSNVDLYKYVIRCEDYSRQDKARILLNHLYFNDVAQDHIEALLTTHSYKTIIVHRNYNPRIIEWMTDDSRIATCSAADYPEMFVAHLDNPADLWRHAFENQLSEASRHLLIALASCGTEVMVDDLRLAFNAYYHKQAGAYGFQTRPSDFARALDELEDNFLRLQRFESGTTVRFHNPSVLDFIAQRLATNCDEVKDILREAVFFEQVNRVAGLLMANDWGGGVVKPVTKGRATLVREQGESFCAAFARTYEAESISVFTGRYGEGDEEICVKFPRSAPQRLSIGVRLAFQLKSSRMNQLITALIDGFVGDVDGSRPNVHAVVSLLQEIDKCKVGDKGKRRQWAMECRKFIACPPNSWVYRSEAVEWVVGNSGLFSDEEFGAFKQETHSAIGSLIPRLVEEASDPSELERLGQEVGTIGQSLHFDVSKELDIIQNRQQSLEETPSPSPDVAFHSASIDDECSDEAIDAMFESLRT